MARGRKPKPTQQKILEGNPGKRPLNKQEPKPQKPVKKPRGMERGVQKFWNEYGPEMERIGVMSGVDVGAFRLMAEHYVLSIWAVQELHQEGLTVEGRDGPKKNPKAQVFKDNSQMALKFMSEFGMTPSSRGRLQIEPDEKQMGLFEQINELMEQGAAMAGVETAEVDDV